MIRRAATVPVSHAAIMVTPDWGIEARDPGVSAGDDTGGVYLCSRDELVSLGLVEHLVIRRPPTIDVDALQRWALDRLRGDHHFASAGLAMMPALLAMNAIDDAIDGPRLARSRLVRRVRQRRVALAEAVADGAGLVICAELAYRGLLAGGCRLELADAFFDDALDLLDNAQVQPPTAGDATPAAAIDEIAANRQRTPGSFDVPLRQLVRRVRIGGRNFRSRWRARHRDRHRAGDQADLVTPSDLLRLPPLVTVGAWHYRDGVWEAASR